MRCLGSCNVWWSCYHVCVRRSKNTEPCLIIKNRKYFIRNCITCNKEQPIRDDIVAKLKKENRSWECNNCVGSKRLSKICLKHGQYGSGSYRSWRKMKDRCLNPNHKYSKYYLQNGITICKKWMLFDGFYEDMGDRPNGYSLDRIDNRLGYFKENCRWIPLHDQPKNRLICKKPYTPNFVGKH